MRLRVIGAADYTAQASACTSWAMGDIDHDHHKFTDQQALHDN